ncbi:AraC-type DNA-binding protein [Ruegeria marina]|uniref:AraC-type DNA-binding protein n=2 Tax=Ruegeria marina TaxID=639004 RepID=A0A1G6I4Q7_9RHOB|nr:AraC-type DNA-binding protein [Ruegeria marina]
MHAIYSPQIVASALTDPFRVYQELGGDFEGLGNASGMNPLDMDETISLSKYVAFFEKAAADLRHPVFGWEVGTHFDLHNIGAFGEFILEAPTLGAALSLFKNAFSLVQSDSELALQVEDDEAVLNYRILDLDIWPRAQDSEMTISVFHQLIKSVAGKDWRPTLVSIEHETSAIWNDARIGPRCPVQYNAPANSLRFPARLLDRPMAQAKAENHNDVSRAFLRHAWQQEREAPVSARVRREIVRRLGRDELDQTIIAAALGLSRRTLRRRLEDESKSFNSILSDCRIRFSEIALRESGKSVSEISDYLGYSTTSAFERAFKSRKGLTPKQFRMQNRSN